MPRSDGCRAQLLLPPLRQHPHRHPPRQLHHAPLPAESWLRLLRHHLSRQRRRAAGFPPCRPIGHHRLAHSGVPEVRHYSRAGVRPRERSRLQLTPDSVGGTRTDAHAPRSAAAGTLRQCIYSGTALRCISPSPLYPRTRCPGLTENGSALRTTPSLPL